MENDHTKNDKGSAPDELLPTTAKTQTRKERSKTNAATNQSTKQKKHGLWRNFKEQTRTKQAELIFLGIVAVGAIGSLLAYVCISIWQGRQAKAVVQMEHAPLVIHPRPPQLLMPFTCDARNNSLTTGNMQSFIKNIGNMTAEEVEPFLVNLPKIIPEKKRGQAFFDDPPIGDCGLQLGKTPMDFPLPPGVEKAAQVRQSVMSLPPLDERETVQFYVAECVYYSDNSGTKYGTCDTYRMLLPSTNSLDALTGSPSFICDGAPKKGIFVEAIGGHCQK